MRFLPAPRVLLPAIFWAVSVSALAQTTTLISPTGAGGFESGTSFAANGWTVVNGSQTNQWYVGTAATGYTGNRCAYIGTASTNNTYNVTASSVVHFYRDITFPAGQPNVSLSFSWKAYGESSYDYVRVYLLPTLTTPVAGALLVTGQLGGDFNLSSSWQTANIGLPCNLPGTTMRLVFSWRNDGSVGTNPPGCIDNISLVSSTSASCASYLGSGHTAVATLPYNSGAGTTCGMGNDLTPANTATCGSTWYLDGEDRVWSFTPTTSGQVTIDLNAPSASYTGLMLYRDCPVTTACGTGSATCIAYAQSSTGSKSMCVNVIAGTNYYLILDSWPSPACNPYNNLSISAVSAGVPNDRPYQAQNLPLGIPVAGDNSCSGNTDEPAAPSCFQPGGSAMNTVWYAFTAPSSGCVRIRTNLGTLLNTQIAAYGPVAGTIAAGNGATLPYIACNQDLPPCGYNTYPSSELTLSGLSAGMTYYISVDGYDNQTGTFTIYMMDAGIGCSIPFPPAPGQDCALAFPVCDMNIIVPDPGPQAVGNICEFSNSVNCLLSGERGSYWYKVKIAANGFLEFDIIPNDWPGAPSTSATDYDFAVWKTMTAGTPGPATCSNLASVPPVSCNYNYLGVTGCYGNSAGVSPAAYPGFGAAYESRIAVNAGDEYLIIVSNFTNSTSGFTLNFSPTSPINTTPPAGSTLVWTGSLSTDWHNAENWGGCAIPSCSHNVTISPIPINQPLVTGLTAVCASLDISMGANLTLQSNSQLKLCGNFVNNGTLNAMSNSTLLMQSDAALQHQSMSGGMTGPNKLWHLTANKPSTAGGNKVLLLNDLENAGNFTLGTAAAYQGGIFDAGGKYHKVAGHFNVYYATIPNAIYTPAGNTLEFNGAAPQNYFNSGALFNVVMNHSGTGVVLGNSGATDYMSIAGTLNLNAGKIITGANRVHVTNAAAASVTAGNSSSYVEGNLKRAFASSGGIYNFPVGTSVRGYQRLRFDFGGYNDRSNATVWFNNTSPSTPVPFLGPECVTTLYDQTPLNHGQWYAQTTPATGTAGYNVTAYNANYSNATTGYTVMVRHNSGSWAVEGACVPASPVSAVQRNGLTTLATTSQFGIAQALSPLPVELISLNAKAGSNLIRVSWTTASELQNAGFEVYRSTAPPEFEKVGWREGAGTVNTLSDYEFDDNEVKSGILYYYRLKQIDYDGHFTWTDMVAARLPSGDVLLTAAPNPFVEQTVVVLYLDEAAQVNLEVISKTGQIVKMLHRGFLTEGIHRFVYDDKSGGVYTVRALVNDKPHHLRLVHLGGDR